MTNAVEVKPTMQDEVVCRTYGKDKRFNTRAKAIEFFKECAMGSEGSEQSRYCNILCQLLDGQCFCTDEID